jgi:hypothetical protein
MVNKFKNNIYLTRFVNNNERYLKVNYSKTLFDDIYMVVVIYGSKRNLKPTGIKKYFFNTLDDTIEYFNKYIEIKYKKGYFSSVTSYDMSK